MRESERDKIPILALLIVLWTAFSLRIAGLDRQSIWYDEGLSIYDAQGSITQVFQRASHSEHPPLYALLLHGWMRACGDSEFSVRALSTWWSVLGIAWLYRLGKKLSPAIGALAALLLAVSPFGIWYAQEARGYALALTLVIATVDLAVDLFPGIRPERSGHPWVLTAAYTILAAAALYAHLYSGLVLLAINVMFLVQAIWARRSPGQLPGPATLRWVVAQAILLAALALWLPVVVAQIQNNATYWHGALGWRQIVRQTLIAFTVGTTLNDSWALGATYAMSLLAVLGTYALFKRRERLLSLLLWAWMAIPVLFQVILNESRPKFAPRYLLNALPAFLLLASAGIRWLFSLAERPAQWARWAGILALLLSTGGLGGATARSLGNLYFDERYYRPDFRAVARYIEAHATPDDLIVLLAGHSYPAFTYYYRGPLPVLPLPEGLLPATQSPIDLSALQTLNQAILGRTQLWLVLWQDTLADPTGLVTDELQHTYRRLGVGRTFHGINLLLFDVSPGPLLAGSTAPRVPLHTNLGGQVQLLGYDLPAQVLYPGDTIYLYLYWQSVQDMTHDYKVFTQLLDGNGQIIVQNDQIAGAAAYPTSHWPTGSIVRDRFMLTIPPETTAGQYPLIVGMYQPGGTLTRLPVQGERGHGDYILLTEIQVKAKPN
jgi:mannosyltransferase